MTLADRIADRIIEAFRESVEGSHRRRRYWRRGETVADKEGYHLRESPAKSVQAGSRWRSHLKTRGFVLRFQASLVQK